MSVAVSMVQFIVCLLIFCLHAEVSHAKFALLIGNENYHIDALDLKYPARDVKTVSNSLEALDFDVTPVLNATFKEFHAAIREFAHKTSLAARDDEQTIGIIYYSGHGGIFSAYDDNYLIPVDITSISVDKLWQQAIPLRSLVNELSNISPNTSYIIVLDACNEELLAEISQAESGSKVAIKTFADLNISYSQPTDSNILIAYSTGVGKKAKDLGIYSGILAGEVRKPGLTVHDVFTNIRRRSISELGQAPYFKSFLSRHVWLAGKQSEDFLAYRNLDSIEAVEDFIDRFPGSAFRATAEERRFGQQCSQLRSTGKAQSVISAMRGNANSP